MVLKVLRVPRLQVTSSYLIYNNLIGLFCWNVIVSLLSSLSEYTGPLLLFLVIEYVQNYYKEPESVDLKYGILLVCGIVVSKIIQAILYAQSNFLLVRSKAFSEIPPLSF